MENNIIVEQISCKAVLSDLEISMEINDEFASFYLKDNGPEMSYYNGIKIKFLLWDSDIDFINRNKNRFNADTYFASFIARRMHDGQKDKGGNDYFYHLERVAERLEPSEYKYGLLHDILEDTELTNEEFISLFGKATFNVIDNVTKRKDEEYENYINRIKTNDISIRVKISDLIDNLNYSRISKNSMPSNSEISRIYLYGYTLYDLNETLNNNAHNQ